MISYHKENVAIPPFPRRTVNIWIRQVAATYGKKVGEVAYIFCDDAKILEVNREYLKHDYYTDIITFDYTQGDTIAGDIFISLDTVKSNCKKFGTDYGEEVHRVVIHGILHLCGLKDKKPGEREQMEKAENKALCMLSDMADRP